MGVVVPITDGLVQRMLSLVPGVITDPRKALSPPQCLMNGACFGMAALSGPRARYPGTGPRPEMLPVCGAPHSGSARRNLRVVAQYDKAVSRYTAPTELPLLRVVRPLAETGSRRLAWLPPVRLRPLRDVRSQAPVMHRGVCCWRRTAVGCRTRCLR
ncbi:hypothetical protein NDU88_006322 [Pleurodeles waltl]|uniref:Uncharacterized protein n=1 Tax=Pleurodeles waltl TaxID=8319 RepID=A0AAV7N0L8_PLEWA|nr:hypothetical protein NDU88_006322 [Pleurodeles waltl]